MATPTFFLPHEALANEPTLLDRIAKQTAQRALISRTPREEDVAQRKAAAYRMLEGVEEEAPTGGYGALFGQRASGPGFRTHDDAAAFLRAVDPEGMATQQKAVGEFMANNVMPTLATQTDPAQRMTLLRELARTGPPILNNVIRQASADGVITDEEMAQMKTLYESYRKPTPATEVWKPLGDGTGGLYRPDTQGDTPTTWYPEGGGDPAKGMTGEGGTIYRLKLMIADPNTTPDRRAAAEAALATIESGNQGGAGRPRTSWQTINGRRVLVSDDNGAVIADGGAAGSGGGSGITIEEGEDGTMRVQIGGKAPSTIVSEAARVSRVISEAAPDLREYASLLNAGVPSYSAGIVGNAVATVTGIGSQVGVNDAIRRAARAVGQNPTPITESKRMQIRVLADRLRNSIGPIITSSLKGAPSNKDMQRAEEAIGLLQTSGSVEEAQLRLALIWRGLQAAQKWSNTVIQTGGVPVSEDLGDMPTGRAQPRPVVPPGGAPRPNRARDLLNRMRQGG